MHPIPVLRDLLWVSAWEKEAQMISISIVSTVYPRRRSLPHMQHWVLPLQKEAYILTYSEILG